MDLGLSGRTVIVTGGTGGIGRHIVRQFAAEGAQVVLTYNKAQHDAELLAKELAVICSHYEVRIRRRLLDQAPNESIDVFHAGDLLSLQPAHLRLIARELLLARRCLGVRVRALRLSLEHPV